MRIGNRSYKVKNSDCWLVFPSLTLTINVWTEEETTYLITGPVKFKNPQRLISNQFQSEFSIEEIDNMDSTLLENNKALEIFDQEVNFDSRSLFELKKVIITGTTNSDEFVEVDVATSVLGFEVWKVDDYQKKVKEIEEILKDLSIPFQTQNEMENQLVRIELN